MKKRLTRMVTLFLVLAMVPAAAFAQSAPADTNAAGMPYVLREFDGTILDVSQYEGKAIWLNFFTGWCYYCIEEMPDIKKAFDSYDPDEVAIVLVHVWSGEDATASAKVVEDFGLQDMILLEDEKMELANLIGLQGFPTSIFIDKEGYLFTSAYAMDFDAMSTILTQMNVARRIADDRPQIQPPVEPLESAAPASTEGA